MVRAYCLFRSLIRLTDGGSAIHRCVALKWSETVISRLQCFRYPIKPRDSTSFRTFHRHDFDDGHTWQMSAPDIVYSVIVPLEEKYKAIQQAGNCSIVFCLLLNRAYFLRDRNLITSALSRTRAALCEKLAIRAIHVHATNMLDLALALTTSWPVYNGADPSLVARAREEMDDHLEERVSNAIEVASISQSRTFLMS